MAADTLARLSEGLAGMVEKAGQSIVRVDDGTRLTAGGLVYSHEGIVVATSHGVERDEDIVLEAHDGRQIEASVVGRDQDTDIAVLRAEGLGLGPLETAAPDSVRVANLAVAVGRPGRAGLEATLGLVSARIETETNGQPSYIVRTDASLFPGFSGGALVDMHGRAIGLLNLMFGRGRGVAVGMPVVDAVVESILKHGSVKRAYLGVRTQLVPLPDSLTSLPGVAQEEGLLVVGVESGSPAEQGGVLLGDTLLAIGKIAVADVDALRAALRGTAPGGETTLRIVRGGVVMEVRIVVGTAG
jgi:S1-C subfamily serine protease